jgi:hypothetical protein
MVRQRTSARLASTNRATLAAVAETGDSLPGAAMAMAVLTGVALTCYPANVCVLRPEP